MDKVAAISRLENKIVLLFVTVDKKNTKAHAVLRTSTDLYANLMGKTGNV